MIMDIASRPDLPIPHTPAQSWTYRIPSPPRVVIPCPDLNEVSSQDFPIGEGVQFDFKSSGFTNSDFLNEVTYGQFMTPSSRLEWKYEQRRTAQRVLPFLYLGPFSAVKDLDFLRNEGVTMVMAVRSTMSAHVKFLNPKAASEIGIQTVAIDVANNQELIAAFSKAIETINLHLSTVYQQQQQHMHSTSRDTDQPTLQATSGKVLIYCETGNERSAAVVVAYIMAMYSIDLVSTINLVQTQRFCISFDDSLKILLQTFETILCARRDISKLDISQQTPPEVSVEQVKSGPSISQLARKTNKRTLDKAYDIEMDTEVGYDQLDLDRFQRREGVAPFEDEH